MPNIEAPPAPRFMRVEKNVAPETAPPLWLIVAAFAAVYLIWGSTYLGIRIAIASIPPMLMAGARFFIAGTALYVVMRLRGAERPEPGHWKSAAIIGAFLLLAGNGGVTWAEQYVPSGITALIIGAVPLWMVLLEWARPGGKRPSALLSIGLLAGFAGVVLIVASRDATGRQVVHPLGAAVLIGATIFWAIGSIWARHLEKPASALLLVGMQMIVGGALQILTGLVLGEAREFSWERITPSSWLAFWYLIIVGALIGYTAYAWLLQVCTPARVSTYAYVNPFIAVILGKVILDEPVPHAVALAGALILGAVVLITRKSAAS